MPVDYDQAVADFEWDVPEDFALPNVLADHAAEFGDRLAVRFRHEDGWMTERTFREVHEDAQRFAAALADLGVGEGDRVMHLFPRHPDAFAVQAGALARGALLVPCSAMLKPKDLAFRANDCEAETVVVHEGLTEMVEPILDETPISRVVVLDAEDETVEREDWHAFEDLVAEHDADHEGPALAAEDPMSINYTSGT